MYSNFSSEINTGGLENEVQLLITAEVLEGAAKQLFFEISGFFLSLWYDCKEAGLKTTFAGYGVEYDLSKRTYVYFRGSNQTVNDLPFATVVVNGAALTAAPTDKSISVNAIGVSHSF